MVLALIITYIVSVFVIIIMYWSTLEKGTTVYELFKDVPAHAYIPVLNTLILLAAIVWWICIVSYNVYVKITNIRIK